MLRVVGHWHNWSALCRPLKRTRVAWGGLSQVRYYLTRHRQNITGAMSWCGWVMAGGAALFAFWELGGFSVLLSHEPFRPAAVHEPARPGLIRPGAEGGLGCTQAPIDRASGQTTPADCPASTLNAETLAAVFAERASPQ